MPDATTVYRRPAWIEKAPKQFREKFERHHKWLSSIEGGER